MLTILSACGFHLRGSYQVPEQLRQVSISAPERSALANQLRQELLRFDIDIVNRDREVTHIELLEDRLDRRVVSLLISGQVAEYELIYTAPLRVYTIDGQVQAHEVVIYRDYQEDPNFALAKTRELELLLSEMREDAAHRIMMLLTRITWE